MTWKKLEERARYGISDLVIAINTKRRWFALLDDVDQEAVKSSAVGHTVLSAQVAGRSNTRDSRTKLNTTFLS